MTEFDMMVKITCDLLASLEAAAVSTSGKVQCGRLEKDALHTFRLACNSWLIVEARSASTRTWNEEPT